MSTDSTPGDALKLAIKRLGSQSALAKLCDVSGTAVWKWLQRGYMSADNGIVLRVEQATGVSRHALRPDIYPLEPSLGSHAVSADSDGSGEEEPAHRLSAGAK
jgi:DNA-binding transcriptional regulator YdaS (Cro superfamily)